MGNDIFFVFNWWLVFFVVGLVFFPLTSLVFSNFSDRGYIFSKILGAVIVSYTVFLFGFARVIPFSLTSVLGILFFFLLINAFVIFFDKRKLNISLKRFKEYFKVKDFKVIIFEEILFFGGIVFWSYIRGHEPSINGLEKFMDFGFINSILRAEYFPPRDMWFTPESINYYYFGHLVTAVLTRLSTLPSSVTYNLMIATIFAFSLTGAFSIGVQFFSGRRKIVSGILCGLLVAFAGNLHMIYAFFSTYNTEAPVPFWQLPFSFSTFPNSYWYPNATRFIVNTIHEFPIYSFVVSDLHGHVLSIPFVLFTIALLLSIFLRKKLSPLVCVLLGFFVSVMYMTNAMDGVIYLLLSVIVILLLSIRNINVKHGKSVKSYGIFQTNINRVGGIKNTVLNFLLYSLLLAVSYVVFSFPFNSAFSPFVTGIGVLCAPNFLVEMGTLGPFLFEADHCQRSPWWQLLTLYGFFLFFTASLFIYYARSKKYVLNTYDYFIVVISLFSFLLLIIPEFVYAKDIYPAHYRANTMFKLAYQAFIMLSIVSGYSAILIISRTKNIIFFVVSVILVGLVLSYSWFATISYYGDLQFYRGIDGLKYLEARLPDDYKTIKFIQENIDGQPVILEAQGDSYTDYERISANTGSVTVLGWTVHEWLWRGTYDIVAPRIEEVRQMYENPTWETTKPLFEKYNVDYVYVGGLEREKYPKIAEDKFSENMDLIFETGDSRLYGRKGL